MTNFNCRTPTVSHKSFIYLFSSLIVFQTLIYSLKLENSAQSVFVIFKLFLVLNMLNDRFKFKKDIFYHFKLFLRYFVLIIPTDHLTSIVN